MPWLLPPIFYSTDEEKAQAIADAEAKGYRVFRDERNFGTDSERPHRLTFEGGWQRRSPSVDSEKDSGANRLDQLVAKLRDNSATLRDVIEYLRIRDSL